VMVGDGWSGKAPTDLYTDSLEILGVSTYDGTKGIERPPHGRGMIFSSLFGALDIRQPLDSSTSLARNVK
jgi:hypothetical protein